MTVFLAHLSARSLQAVVVILAIFFVRRLFGNRLAPAIRHAMWGFVVIALLVPGFVKIPLPEQTVAAKQVPSQNTGDFSVERLLPFEEPLQETEISANGDSLPATSSHERRLDVVFAVIFPMIFAIWLGGVAWFCVLMSRQMIAQRRRLRRRNPVCDANVCRVFNECLQTMRIRRTVEMFECERVRRPMLCGVLRPMILLPMRSRETLTAEQWSHVFRHELAHVRRRDILTGWLMSLLAVLHWFNPLIWAALRRFNNDAEEAADRLAVSQMARDERIRYGMTLLDIASQGQPVPHRTMPGTLGVFESHSQLSRRIKMIKDTKTHRKCWTLTAVAICTLACVAALTRLERTMTEAGEIVPDQTHVGQFVPDTQAVTPTYSGHYATSGILPPHLGDAEAVEPDEPQVMFRVIIAELPESGDESPGSMLESMQALVAELGKRSDDESDLAMTHEMTTEAFRELEQEGKLTILSRPQIMAMDNQLAIVCVGSRESGYMCGIIPRLVNDRIIALISFSKGDLTVSETTFVPTQRFEGIVSLQENEPFVGCLSKSSQNNQQLFTESFQENWESQKLLLCLTADIIPPKKAAE